MQSPHCQLLKSQRKDIEERCATRKIDYKFVKSSADWSADQYLKVSNYGSHSFSRLSKTGLVDSILDDKLFADLQAELVKTGRSDRGSVQRYAGYATMNQKFDSIHSITAPQMIITMDKVYVQKMVDFTSLIKSFCREFKLTDPYSDDPIRTHDWSQRLCREHKVDGENLIEHVTFALTCLDSDASTTPIIFGSHVDHLNDRQWPEVFCVYKHFLKDGKLYRLAAIAYSRSIIRLFRFKDQGYHVLHKKILSYLRSPTNKDRINLSLESCVPGDASKYQEMNGVSYRKSIPYLDKAGFYSGFADAILKVWDGKNVERLCELLILVGWIPTASTFQMILTEWQSRPYLPPENWTLAYIDDAVRSYNGISNGPGPRCRPWMNRPLLQGKLVDGLFTLRSALLNTEKGNKDLPYARLHKMIQEIGGVGPLGAQHIIGVASLLNVIHPRYQSIATIAETTMTAKKVKQLYNLSAVVLEKQKYEVAMELGCSEKIVESGYCEMFREEVPTLSGDIPREYFDEISHAAVIKKRMENPQHPDMYFKGQILRTVKDGVLVELYRGEDNQELVRVLPYVALVTTKAGPTNTAWNQMKSTEELKMVEIHTSIKHTSDVPIGGKEKRTKRARKKVTHTGFGVHTGLEELLKRRKLCNCSADVVANLVLIISGVPFKIQVTRRRLVKRNPTQKNLMMDTLHTYQPYRENP
jgi:hypothetical protein